MRVVYSAGRQLIKVRLLLWGSAILFVAAQWQGLELFRTYGLREADGGVLAPLAVRLAWGLAVAALGIAALAGMWAYGRRYVAAIRLDDDSAHVEIDTPGVLRIRTMRVPASHVRVGRSHHGHLRTARATVRAPWSELRVDGVPRRLIVDAQGEFLAPELEIALRKAGRPGRAGAP